MSLTSADILPLLACPECKKGISRDGDALFCLTCGRRFPVVDGIPDLVSPDLKENDRSRIRNEVDFFGSHFQKKGDYQVYAPEEYPRILDLLGLRDTVVDKGRRVLSIGCGAGIFERELIRRNYRVVGIDLSLNFLKKCDFPVLRADAVNLPFSGSAFDHVLCIGVVHHLPSERHKDILSEARRVLKKGGTLHVFEPHTTTRSRFTHPLSQILGMRSSGERPVSLSRFEALAELFSGKIDVGFVKEVKLVNYNFFIIFLYRAAKMIFDMIPGSNNNEFFILIGERPAGFQESEP